MDSIIEVYNKIHSIPLLFAFAVAILLPFAIIVVGYMIQLLGEAIATLFGIVVDPWLAHGLINYLTIPGVVLHELSHAFFAYVTGAKVIEVAPFKKDQNSLGHVYFRNRGNKLVVALQNIFISSAPLLIGTIVVYGCYCALFVLPASLLWLKIVVAYIGVSMFFHMTMSVADIKVYVKGIPLFMCIIFILAVILRLTNVIMWVSYLFCEDC